MLGQILLMDDDMTSRCTMKARLTAANYTVRTPGDVDDALHQSPAARAILIRNRDTAALARQIEGMLRRVRMPVVAICAPAQRLTALKAGVGFLLDQDCDDVVMRARLRSWLALPSCHGSGFADQAAGFNLPDRIALLSGDIGLANFWRKAVASATGQDLRLISPREKISRLTEDCAVLLVDSGINGEGMQHLADFRAQLAADGRGAALAMLQRQISAQEEARAFDLGASEVLSAWPQDRVGSAEFRLRMQALMQRGRNLARTQREVSSARRLATVDPLTELFNRRALEAEITRLMRSGDEFGLIMADIDHFKAINDCHGHRAGDAVLSQVGEMLRTITPVEARIARWGGEEFMMLLPRADETDAVSLAEDVRQKLASRPIQVTGLSGPAALQVSVSVGVSVRDGNARSVCPDTLINCADAAMLAAKQAGRNRVMLARSANAVGLHC